MEIHREELPEITRYLQTYRTSAEEHERRLENYLRLIARFHELSKSTRILEIGTGTGWLPVMLKARGYCCKGLEISPQLIANAMKLGAEFGVAPDIELGNVEDAALGEEQFDVIIASSVFEHVQQWRAALERVFRALRPGGLFYFSSTNRFAPRSHEYGLPFYGWLPDKMRYRLRIAMQGEEIMRLGIDFNQFTPWQLRRAFRETGFRQVLDVFEYYALEDCRSAVKRGVLRAAKASPAFRAVLSTFFYGNLFLCIK